MPYGQRRHKPPRRVRPGVPLGGRRRSGAGAYGPGPRTCPLPGLPGSGRVGVAHPPPPPLWVFHHRQKGNGKARPFAQPDHAPSTARKKVVATASRCEGACNRAGEPSGAFSGEEPRRNKRSPGKGTLPGPSRWSPRRRGARPMKRCQEGARQRLHPPGKAAAHALRAAAASSAPPQATAAGRLRPLVREYRRPRRT